MGISERQRRRRSALSLNVFAVRPSIGQALATDTLGEFISAALVVYAQSDAVVMAEIKFSRVTMQMLLAAC